MGEEIGTKKSKSQGNGSTRWAIFKRSLRRELPKMKVKLLGSAFKWRRVTNLQISFVDDLLFKIVSMLEAVVLGGALCFFFLCCGCHFWNSIPHFVFSFSCPFFYWIICQYFWCFIFLSVICKILRILERFVWVRSWFLVGKSLVLCRAL